jgi:HPt (histidine-containing phosphotransfer) domain-containing protein
VDDNLESRLATLRARYLDHRLAESPELDSALLKGDFLRIQDAGHNLKGTGATYGFTELTDLGRALEAAAKAGDAARVEILLHRIDTYLSTAHLSEGQLEIPPGDVYPS